jgi:4-amino-4-deoxy-L-arabinose transferase-like glycosyltransferase
MVKNKYFVLIILLVIFFLVKIPILLTSIYKIFDPREMYIGTIAKALIEGPIMPLFDYQFHYSVGGSLVSGILAVPFFLMFGQSYFSLKLLAISYSASVLILWYIFLAKYFNKRVALLASLLFIFSPPFYTKFLLMIYGKHGETNLFTIVAIFIFFRVFFDSSKDESNKKFAYAAFGLLSGFGMYFDPMFFITLATCSLFWFIFNKKFILSKGFLFFITFFLIGFSPWIYYNGSHGFKTVCLNDRYPEAARSLQELFPSNFFIAAFNNLKELLISHLPHSFSFTNFWSIPGSAIEYAYYLVFILAFCVLVWSNRKVILSLTSRVVSLRQPDSAMQSEVKETFLLTFLVIHLLLLSVIAYAIDFNNHELYSFYGYRRLLPLYPFMFAIMALFLDKLWRWKNKHVLLPAISFLLMIFLILSGLIANIGLITPVNFGNHLIYEGYSYYEFGNLVGRNSGGNISKVIYLLNKIKEPYRPLFCEGIGAYWGHMFYKKQPLHMCIAEINKIDPKYRFYALRGLGLSIGAECGDDMLRADQDISEIDKESKPYVYEGLGEWIGLIWGHNPDLCVSRVSKITRQYQAYFYRGMGEMVGFKFGQNTAYCIGLSEKIEAEYQCYYFEGLARTQGWRYKYYLKKEPSSFIKQIPQRCQPFLENRLQEIE